MLAGMNCPDVKGSLSGAYRTYFSQGSCFCPDGAHFESVVICFSFPKDYNHFASRELIKISLEILFDWDLVSFFVVPTPKTSPVADDETAIAKVSHDA